MADNAFSTMSDEDLLSAVNGAKQAQKGPTDEELLAAVGQKPAQPGYTADVAKSFGAGLLKGTGSALDSAQAFTPAGMVQNTANWAGWIGHKLRPDVVKEMTPEMKHFMVPDMGKAVSDLTAGAPDYEPKTTPGRYAKTTGEFIPSAVPFVPKGTGLLPKATSILQNAVVPAISSEAASDAARITGNEKYEPAARLAGALVSPLGSEAIVRKLSSAISPTAGANPERLRNADVLESFGIPVTAGQRTGSPWLMEIEGASPEMRAISGQQPAAFTKAVMRLLGSDKDIATPETIREAHEKIVGDLGSIANSVDVVPDVSSLTKLHDGFSNYLSNLASTTQMAPASVSGMIRQVMAAYKSGAPIPGSVLREWRTKFNGSMSSTTDLQLKSLYKSAVDSIDDMVSNSLKASGREDDWAALQDARRRYRDYLAVEPAVLKADNGVLNPSHVMSSVASQSKKALAKGTRGDLGDLTMAARNALTKLPNVDRTKTNVGRVVAEGLGGVGLGALGLLHSVPTAVGLGSIGVAGPLIKGKLSDWKHDFLTSDIGQRYAANQKLPGRSKKELSDWVEDAAKAGAVAASANGMISGGDERMGRKSGGRVQPHVTIGNRLVTAADRAKKTISKQTEPLLNAPDETIVHALEVANRSI